MSDQDQRGGTNSPPVEPAPRPARKRRGNPVSGPRRWLITATIAAVLLGVMYGVTAHRAEVQDEQRQAEMQHDATPPGPGLPGQPGQALGSSANTPPSSGAIRPGG